MRVHVAICDECGALSTVPDDHAEATLNGPERKAQGEMREDEDDTPPTVGRCAIVYEKDDGPEGCGGNAIIKGVLTLGDLA